jgi:hypothetical protein
MQFAHLLVITAASLGVIARAIASNKLDLIFMMDGM